MNRDTALLAGSDHLAGNRQIDSEDEHMGGSYSERRGPSSRPWLLAPRCRAQDAGGIRGLTRDVRAADHIGARQAQRKRTLARRVSRNQSREPSEQQGAALRPELSWDQRQLPAVLNGLAALRRGRPAVSTVAYCWAVYVVVSLHNGGGGRYPPSYETAGRGSQTVSTPPATDCSGRSAGGLAAPKASRSDAETRPRGCVSAVPAGTYVVPPLVTHE